MAKKRQATLIVRKERLPNHRAVERVREAYHHLGKVTNSESEGPIQEAQYEPVGSNLCTRVNATTRAGGDD